MREARGEKYYRLCEARLEAWTELKLVRIEKALSQVQPECGGRKAGVSASSKSRTIMPPHLYNVSNRPIVEKESERAKKSLKTI